MALIGAAAAGPDGSFVAPTFEPGGPPRVIGQFISKQSAAELRAMMRAVVESGTAAGVIQFGVGNFGRGKDRDCGPRRLRLMIVMEIRSLTRILEDGRKEYRIGGFTDSWFVGFAPAENPQIVFAVLVENGGQGARLRLR
jgi:cell division protein FtsI/penicillin-binding protein 2